VRVESHRMVGMSSKTIRMPPELMERVRRVAARDYAQEGATIRRLVRLGLEADERREQVDAPRETAEAVA
jgi:predicted DNA-binding protein